METNKDDCSQRAVVSHLTNVDIADLYHASQDQPLREQDADRVRKLARAVEAFLAPRSLDLPAGESEWHTFANPPAETIHTRLVGGVLCRWWGDGPVPPGVALIDAAAAPSAPDLHFNAQRLRNVATLLGLTSAVPEDDATLDGARGAVLGQIAAKLRTAGPSIASLIEKHGSVLAAANEQDRLARTAGPGESIAFINRGEQPEDTAHLDCPHCGGSGHKDDVTAAPAPAVDAAAPVEQAKPAKCKHNWSEGDHGVDIGGFCTKCGMSFQRYIHMEMP